MKKNKKINKALLSERNSCILEDSHSKMTNLANDVNYKIQLISELEEIKIKAAMRIFR